MEKKALNSKMRDIIRILHKKSGSMTANEISKETGISYITVQKYLSLLEKKGVVFSNEVKKKKSSSKSTSRRYDLNYDLIYSKKRNKS